MFLSSHEPTLEATGCWKNIYTEDSWLYITSSIAQPERTLAVYSVGTGSATIHSAPSFPSEPLNKYPIRQSLTPEFFTPQPVGSSRRGRIVERILVVGNIAGCELHDREAPNLHDSLQRTFTILEIPAQKFSGF